MVSECSGTPTSQSGGLVVKAALGNGNTVNVRKASKITVDHQSLYSSTAVTALIH